jgi:predicted dehydrogenase
MQSKTRIGFVGVGNMGQCAHLRHYATLPGCEVVALADIRLNLVKQVAAKYGVARVYGEAAEMLAREQLDGIVAVQRFTNHGVVLSNLYQAGIPMLTEKPLAGSVEVGEQLLAVLARGGSLHIVGYHKRSDPAIMFAKQEIDRLNRTGESGALRYVRITVPGGDWQAGGFFDLLRSDEPVPHQDSDPPATDMDAATYQEYLALVNGHIHQINLLRHLLGEPYRVVFADRPGRLLVAESQTGVTGIIERTPYSTSLDWQESVLIAFERGYIKVDLPAPLAINHPGRVEIMRDAGRGVMPTTTVPILPPVSAMRQQASNFVRAIKDEIEPLCQASEALEDLRVAREYLRIWKGV